MRSWDAKQVAAAAGARVVAGAAAGPARAVIDSRAVEPGDLFVGLPGSQVDGGRFAAGALDVGAWGVLVAPTWAGEVTGGAVLAADDPLRALGLLARSWRRELGSQVIAVTGSVGKTSTKDLIAAVLSGHRSVVASRANFNTEIGMPLEILGAPVGTEVLVLEAAMRGFGQIGELAEICEPDVGVITNIGPVHLEQVGSLEGVARAKGELLVGMRDGGTAVVPAGEALLEPYLRPGLRVRRFGEGGDVVLDGDAVVARGERLDVELAFTARHQRTNALAAVAAALAVGVRPSGRVEAPTGALRGELVPLPDGAVAINDCYNASPLSMRAALDELAAYDAGGGRRLAVLGDMLELGAEEAALHREVGTLAGEAGVELLVTVGPRAAAMLETFDGEGYAVADAGEAAALTADLIAPGDVVLVKGSRGVGLEVVAPALAVAEAPRG
ncbi:MAG TPA: UDP-N-acetylmuramoyl-tripeptide--D-alanyl-D-alanine ligase [Solirubrobacteraceae bacterium]|nr:UDP-N-acetylmuramoyl-tripeptide--D-alanyl-D-alanine ligase [Solirubrobacteraceae bacterium]